MAKRWEIEVLRYLDRSRRLLTGLPVVATSQITPHLFVGGQYKLDVFDNLKALGITAIVNMRMHSVHLGKKAAGVSYLHLPTIDGTAPTLENLNTGVEFITQQIKSGGKVYVHCRAGEGRGPTMAAAYLISTGLTLEDSLKTIKKVRKFIRPTWIQLKRLKEYEAYYSTRLN